MQTKKLKVDHNFFESERKNPIQIQWEERGSLLVGIPSLLKGSRQPANIAAFDLDGTIIKTRSAKKFPIDEYDWQFWHDSVVSKLREVSKDHIIVILTNQMGLRKSLKSTVKRTAEFKAKISKITNTLNIPIWVYIATENDIYRKPRVGMWREFLSDLNAKFIADDTCFLVGDAAGRINDHSCCDRQLASNIKIMFYTPEEFFLGLSNNTEFSWGVFQPKQLINERNYFTRKNKQDILLCVGYPCSGKSTFVKNFAQALEYVRVNQDALGNLSRCINFGHSQLKNLKSIIIDNTNPGIDTRKRWIDVAREYDIPIRCIHFTASEELARHNNFVRAFSESAGKSQKLLPDIAFIKFRNSYCPPNIDEGFQDITRIDFVCDDDKREVWCQWWNS